MLCAAVAQQVRYRHDLRVMSGYSSISSVRDVFSNNLAVRKLSASLVEWISKQQKEGNGSVLCCLRSCLGPIASWARKHANRV
jgi:hypothetical protein